MNARIHETGTQVTKRFFNLDGAACRDGALHVRTKELLGLVASTVLRCDDCKPAWPPSPTRLTNFGGTACPWPPGDGHVNRRRRRRDP
jgi:hypothetical protein